jgi:FkbM family methyltransferase
LVPPGGLCFDVGAHLGNRTRAWRSLGARVVAVEPHPDLLPLLRALFGRDPGVHIVGAALGAGEGEATLLADPANPTVTTLSSEWIRELRDDAGFANIRWQPRQTVTVTTLDALIGAFGVPDFVKIDVEGFEAEVLGGLSAALPCLSFECLPVARERAYACLDRLEGLGDYRFNWSPGESHRLALPDWTSPEGIRRLIRGLPAQAGSGDVYARLCGAGR